MHCTIPGAPELVNHDLDNNTLAHDMFVSKHVHLVTPETLCQSGFSGWWSPGDKVFATADIAVGCAVLGRGAEPTQFWVLLIWLEPGISHVTWVHYDATMCLACLVCSVLPVLHFLRFGLFVL